MVVSALDAKPPITAEGREFYQRLAEKNAAPLWEVLAELVPPEPKTRCVPTLWQFDEQLRPLLVEAGSFITAQEAERRVLMLENPGIRPVSQITQSLYAGIQSVLPGELAPTHRHTASALRFVLESDGGYTAVDGERTIMHPGDFIVTPSWTYHDHGNLGSKPVMWLDVLDIPIVNMLDSSFAEHHPQEIQPVTKPEGDSQMRYGANMMPVDYAPQRQATPIFSYPWSRSRETLEQMSQHSPLHASYGFKMRFVNPATGGFPMPTIATFMQLLPKGFRGEAYRSTDATVYCAAEGCGRSIIGGQTFSWKQRDIFVVPSWVPVQHECDGDAVLFSASDRPLQKMLGLWREQVPSAL
jgi:gentisate 1,2-dioxygenase